MQIQFALEKTTPGTIRYMQVDAAGKQLRGDDDGATAPTLYLRKKALGENVPQKLKVTIEAA